MYRACVLRWLSHKFKIFGCTSWSWCFSRVFWGAWYCIWKHDKSYVFHVLPRICMDTDFPPPPPAPLAVLYVPHGPPLFSRGIMFWTNCTAIWEVRKGNEFSWCPARLKVTETKRNSSGGGGSWIHLGYTVVQSLHSRAAGGSIRIISTWYPCWDHPADFNL